MSADYQLSFQDYLAIARRWAPASILLFGVILSISVVVALILPRVYESTGTLLVEAPQIPRDIVRAPSPVSAEQRINAIGQRIMTRESLLRIAAQYQVFESESPDAPPLKDSDVVQAMRSSIGVQVLIGNNWERPSDNFAFNVSFQHGKPEKALEVANALIQLFLESSARQRVEQASRTNEFLNQEAERVRTRLEELEGSIAAYKRR
ncbi:MAG: lipopolysaccharide biosynthesis protein, partial [Comamonadaceae bacterium]|nr:lipopolysaccharide biosynthesis protein [Comamonadaceae bacterium]